MKKQDRKLIEIMKIVKNTRGKEGKRIVNEILKKGERPDRMNNQINEKERELR